jgi:hypothetical protein
MRRTTTLASLLVVVALLGVGITLLAADSSSSWSSSKDSDTSTMGATSGASSTGTGTSAWTGSASTGTATTGSGTMGNMSESQILSQDAENAKKMGMSDSMQMRRKMLMGMQVNVDDPGAVMALQSDLNLTQDQIDKIKKIQDNARKDARNVLTSSQRQQIAGLEGTPQSMVSMCREMSQQGMTSTTPGATPMTGATTGTAGTYGGAAGATTGTAGTSGSTTGTAGTYGGSAGTSTGTGSSMGTTGTSSRGTSAY